MIRILLLTLLCVCTIALCVALGSVIADNVGYVLITIAGWKIEMTIVSAVIMVTLFAISVWFLLKVCFTFFTIGKVSFSWFSGYGSRNKQKLFDEAMLAWFRNDLDKAKVSLKKLEGSELDGIQFDGLELLLLADVASKQNDIGLQKEILTKATKLTKTRETASLLLAKSHIDTGEQSSGLALIAESNDGRAALLKLEALAQSGQWRELSESLEKWKRQLPKAEYLNWKEKAASGVMSEIASKEGAKQLIEYWEKQPGRMKKDTPSQASFVKQLILQGLHQEAETYLVKFQPKKPSSILLPLFRELKVKQPVESKKKLETWLKQDEENGELLSVLGQLAFNSNDFILAEKVLQKAIKLHSNKTDIHLLAQVKEAAQDNVHALQLYKQLI